MKDERNWSVLLLLLFCTAVCVLVPGTLAFYMLYVGELQLFGLPCFTAVCDLCDQRHLLPL